MFPDNAFTPKDYAGVSMMVLRAVDKNSGKIVNNDAFRLVEWLERGAFDALDKGYLERIILNVHDKDPADDESRVVECYTFRISPQDTKDIQLSVSRTAASITRGGKAKAAQQLTQQGSIGKVHSREDIEASMKSMIKTLVVLTSSLKQLPQERWISMQLTYRQGTPREYEPEHFQPAPISSLPKFVHDPVSIKVGELTTGIHSVTMKLRQPDENVGDTTAAEGGDVLYSSGEENDAQKRKSEATGTETIEVTKNLVSISVPSAATAAPATTTTTSASTAKPDVTTSTTTTTNSKLAASEDSGAETDSTEIDWSRTNSREKDGLFKKCEELVRAHPSAKPKEVLRKSAFRGMLQHPGVLSEFMERLTLQVDGEKFSSKQQAQTTAATSSSSTTTTTAASAPSSAAKRTPLSTLAETKPPPPSPNSIVAAAVSSGARAATTPAMKQQSSQDSLLSCQENNDPINPRKLSRSKRPIHQIVEEEEEQEENENYVDENGNDLRKAKKKSLSSSVRDGR